MAEKTTFASLARIAAVLTLICTLVAVLLAGVYALTNETYESNLLATKQKAIASLFAFETVDTEALPTEGFAVEELYRVSKDGAVLGYCANVKSAGFGGNIDMMVAVAPDGALLGVKIVAMSETPGLGSRAGEDAHLDQYKGAFAYGDGEYLTLGEHVDAISGATVSSKAINAGVNAALQALLTYQNEGEGMQ
ncbi:MAG: FMN-binding protein [Clostridia bacterium]|nr:FMN-binding protein [Clostridia bacterium]